jgi:hypothetical protein
VCAGFTTPAVLVLLGQTVDLNCNANTPFIAGFTIAPEYIDIYFVPATWEVT